jgi:MFS family permease
MTLGLSKMSAGLDPHSSYALQTSSVYMLTVLHSLLALGASQLSFGKLYSIYSQKIVFMASVALLEVGSLICALSKNSIVFIVGRAFAGLGAAGILSGVMM